VTCSYHIEPSSWDLQSQRLGSYHMSISIGLSLNPLDAHNLFHPRGFISTYFTHIDETKKKFHQRILTKTSLSQLISYLPS